MMFAPHVIGRGVQQGPGIGPVFCHLWKQYLAAEVNVHSYADDTQLYLPLKPEKNKFQGQLKDRSSWMTLNFLPNLDNLRSLCMVLKSSGTNANSCIYMSDVCLLISSFCPSSPLLHDCPSAGMWGVVG